LHIPETFLLVIRFVRAYQSQRSNRSINQSSGSFASAVTALPS
jgi:hypothetical protein